LALSQLLTRTESFAHDGFAVEMTLPESSEELIDVSEFNQDERLPYWAELWPSALALTRHLLEGSLPAGRVMELGCGLALPSLALAWRGVRALATDYYEDALAFVRLNAERNGIAPPETRLFDWRESPAALGRFDLVLAADVAYEKRNAEMLAALIPGLVAPGGRVLLADPGREYMGDLLDALRAEGWSVREVETRLEASPAGPTAPNIRVRIVEVRPT
jgi:predicted nicotinamide N-methyase